MREDETERACCEVRGACGSLIWEMEFERFTEAGCGIAELKLMPPSVYTNQYASTNLVFQAHFSRLSHAEQSGILRHVANVVPMIASTARAAYELRSDVIVAKAW